MNQFAIFFRVIGREFDELKGMIFRVRNEANVASASEVMLPVHGQDRDMPRLMGETVEAYRTRLSMKGIISEWSGTRRGILYALAALGYEQAHIEPVGPQDPEHWAEFIVDLGVGKLGISKRTVERLVQTARDLTPEAKKTIRDAGDKITKGAALKISRLPPDQQAEAAAVLMVAPPAPKGQGMIDGEVALTEFKTLCSRYVSGIESLHRRTDVFARMTISQFDELGDSAYSVTTAIKEFFEKVHEIRHEMENDHEN